MPTNQIVPFGTGPGANVMTPAAYAALTSTTQGYAAGVAQSVQLNTTWRQSSFVAAALAQLLADYGPSNVNDDGIIANFETQLHQVINRAFNRWTWIGQFGGTANALTATLTPAPDSLAPGHKVRGVIGALNTGATTLTVLGATYPVTLSDGTPMAGGELTLFEEVEFTAYGLLGSVASFVMTSPLPLSFLNKRYLPLIYATTFYVATTGSDTTGTGTFASPWATIQNAINVISGYQSQNTVTINVAAGNYTAPGGTTLANFPKSQIASWNLQGAGVASTNFIATATGCRGVVASAGAQVNIGNFTVSSYYEAVFASGSSQLYITGAVNVIGGGSTAYGVSSSYNSMIWVYANMTFSGSFAAVLTTTQAYIQIGYKDVNITYSLVITFSGAVTAAVAVANSSQSGTINFATAAPVTWAGTIPTGIRYSATGNGGVNTAGAGATWIPGTSAGTVGGYGAGQTGGWYA